MHGPDFGSNLVSVTLPDIVASMQPPHGTIRLDGKSLTMPLIAASWSNESDATIADDPALRERMERSYQAMRKEIELGFPVYGCNTAYGGRAGRVINEGSREERVAQGEALSAALVFLDVGVGQTLPKEIVRAAMAIRANMLLGGVSGIRLQPVETLIRLLNADITPKVQEYGGIGASGDLIHNQRVVSVLRGLPGALAVGPNGSVEESADLLARHGIEPLQLAPKEGLALVNGDNFSAAMAAYATQKVSQCFLISIALGAMTIEVLKGTDRPFHPLLSKVRAHEGQREIADLYRYLLQDSKLAFQELRGHILREPGVNVQEAYSLRCLPQYEGAMLEQLKWCVETITVNVNSSSDNPLWVAEECATPGEVPWQWISGGNFMAMHMAEALDTLRKITTQLVKKHDRHLARLIDANDSNGLPANLSCPDSSVTHCTFKGVQILSGMLEVQSMMLANPVTTLFGIHEERNQDITSHATTSGNLALKNLELLKYSISGNLLAVAQAVDLRGGPVKLSPRSRPLYRFVREHCDFVREERPLHQDIETIAATIEDGSLVTTLLRDVMLGFTLSNCYTADA